MFFVYFCGQAGWAELPETGNKSEPKNHKTAQIFLRVMKRHRFPPRRTERFPYLIPSGGRNEVTVT